MYYVGVSVQTKNNSIKIRILKNDKEIEIKENKTAKFTLTKNEEKQDNYKLEITYDKSKNINMEDIVKQLQIKVHSEQKQGVL